MFLVILSLGTLFVGINFYIIEKIRQKIETNKEHKEYLLSRLEKLQKENQVLREIIVEHAIVMPDVFNSFLIKNDWKLVLKEDKWRIYEQAVNEEIISIEIPQFVQHPDYRAYASMAVGELAIMENISWASMLHRILTSK